MPEVAMALKNLWRHKRRTILTGLVVAFGVLLYSAFDSLLLGFAEDSLRNLVRYETGDLTVHAPGYWAKREELPLDRVIPDVGRLAAELRRIPGVRGAAPQLVFNAAVNTGAEELPVKAIGTDPGSDAAVLGLRQAVRAGRYLQSGRNEALLGRELARLMDLRVGDTFTLVLRTQSTSFEALDLEVAGILGSNSPAVNVGLYLPLDVAQAAVALPGAATQVLLASEAGYRHLGELPALVQKTVRESGRNLDVKTWTDWSGNYLAAVMTDRQNMKVILVIVGIIAALGIVNSVLLAGMERSREIGTLKALGMTEQQITHLFMLEGMGLGLFGGLIGALLSAGAVAYLAKVGIDYSQFSGYDFGLGVEGVFRGVWNWPAIFGAWAVGALVSFLISYWPARRSARLDPAVVLRG
jgi:putative ABC transport system permease protein